MMWSLTVSFTPIFSYAIFQSTYVIKIPLGDSSKELYVNYIIINSKKTLFQYVVSLMQLLYIFS